jgi:hypothetical protein
VAVNCCVVPLAIVAVAGATLMETSVGDVPVPVNVTLCGVKGALSVN